MNVYTLPLSSILVLFAVHNVFAQPGVERAETSPADTTRQQQAVSLTASALLSFSQFSERSAMHAGGSIGVMRGRSLMVEGYFQTMLDRFTKRVIFPEVYRFKMWNAGLSMRYLVLSRRQYYLYAGLNAGLGRASWHPLESNAEAFTDNVYLLSPELGAAWVMWSSIAVEGGVRYNISSDFELVGLEENILEGVEFSVRLRFIKRSGL